MASQNSLESDIYSFMSSASQQSRNSRAQKTPAQTPASTIATNYRHSSGGGGGGNDDRNSYDLLRNGKIQHSGTKSTVGSMVSNASGSMSAATATAASNSRMKNRDIYNREKEMKEIDVKLKSLQLLIKNNYT